MKIVRLTLALFVSIAWARVALAAPPNIIVILADDMGYSDPGCYGGELSTPAIDRLAREGVRLTHFQNGGMCVVSRTSLMTGNWWPRALPHFAQTPLLPEKLHESGYRILFLSDNGTDSFSVMDQPLLRQGKLPGDPASNWQPGTGWAYASVTPWRLYKISQHGGGVTTGAIAWWPGKTGRPGRIEASPVHMVDVLPTLLATAQASSNSPPPANVAGESFLPLLHGQPWHRQGPLFFQYMDNRAIRTGEWTLAEVDGEGWELFHVASDPLENRNVAAQHPAVVADLNARWLNWWRAESGESTYTPKSTKTGPNYRPQGDRGSGDLYRPSAMPATLSDRLPLPSRSASP